jgi:hypothetical protein
VAQVPPPAPAIDIDAALSTPAPDIDAVLSGAADNHGVVTVTSSKHRRLKDGVNKEKNFEREMTCSERDLIIRWWNQNQRLIPKDDPVCADLAQAINGTTTTKAPVSAMQVAGYLSYLCRMGRWLSADRDARFERTKKRGAITILPVYSAALITAINENWEREREDERLRAEAHARMRAARQAGQKVRVRTMDAAPQAPVRRTAPVNVPVSAPVQTSEEDFDFRF